MRRLTRRHASKIGTGSSLFWSLTIAVVVLPGCCRRPHSPFKGLTHQEARALAERLALRRDRELQADLRSAFVNHPPKNVLILSGGDAHGAFGCGILNGWRNAPAGRPKFDVVTGVSTGALIATFAFLGEEQDDATLREVYTTIRDKDVFKGLFNSSSVFGTAPLKRLIARYVTQDAIRRVAAAHYEGRRLYATTVELESGAVCIWPLSKIAFDAIHPTSPLSAKDSGGDVIGAANIDPGGVERFRQVLLAAASIPVFFPPVEIDGGVHFDAGLREALSLRLFMLGLRRAGDAASVQAADPSSMGKPIVAPTVWAVINGKLRSPPEAIRNNLLSIGARSLEVYNETVVILSLRDAAHVAATHSPPFQFRWLSEPDELEAGPGMSLFQPMFDPKVTKRLYAAGEPLGQAGPSAWKVGPPPLDADELVRPDN